MTIIWTIAAICGLSVIGLLTADTMGHAIGKAVSKTVASLAFIILALAAGGLASSYGQWIVTGLVFCFVGDVCLLSSRKPLFLAGMGAFALGHGAYIGAFVSSGADFNTAVLTAIAASLAVNAAIVGWFWPHLGEFRLPVAIYSAIIGVMVGMSFGAAPHGARPDWIIVAGAIGFAISDISVARDRFVAPAFSNRFWGLPLYYGAQLLLASSV